MRAVILRNLGLNMLICYIHVNFLFIFVDIISNHYLPLTQNVVYVYSLPPVRAHPYKAVKTLKQLKTREFWQNTNVFVFKTAENC